MLPELPADRTPVDSNPADAPEFDPEVSFIGEGVRELIGEKNAALLEAAKVSCFGWRDTLYNKEFLSARKYDVMEDGTYRLKGLGLEIGQDCSAEDRQMFIDHYCQVLASCTDELMPPPSAPEGYAATEDTPSNDDQDPNPIRFWSFKRKE